MASGSQVKTVDNARDSKEPAPDTLQESSFDNLRQKIEGQLKSKKSKSDQKPTRTLPKKQTTSKEKEQESRGTKRKHDGQTKNDGEAQRSKSKATDNVKSAPKEKDVDLKAIIAELGGTEEDLDLINGAQSDSEMEGQDSQPGSKDHTEARKGKTLESGMANILREIALVKKTYKDDESENEKEVKVNGTAATARPQADDKASRAPPKQDDLKTSTVQIPEPQIQKGRQSRLKCTPQSDWYDYQYHQVVADHDNKSQPSVQSMENLHAHARKLLQAENDNFKSTQNSSSSQAFYNTVIASGTLSDKISALTLAVQESPLHNMRALENLINLAGKRSRSQAVDVLRALKDLLAQGSLLPSNRKLYTFNTQPGLATVLGGTKTWHEGDRLPHDLPESVLIAWAFEDWLKGQYFEILKILETWCNDEIEFAKTRATSYVYELLKEKPEQEANLLRLLINKLGDPVKKISSQASYLIMQLLTSHPAMKEVVVSAIDTDLVFKPGQTLHARYYAVVTLNQTALSTKEEHVAAKLLNIYFGLFKFLLKPGEEKKAAPPVARSRHQRQRKQAAALPSTEQEDELKEKLVSAILTGVNRAYPYCGTDHQSFDEHLDTLFQITHSANFNTSIQAMLLIQQLISNTSTSSDRFYRTLYESLLDPRLVASSKQQLYLNLLHRSLKADVSQKRVKAFVKRILQILSLQEPSFVCAAFFLLKDLEKTFPSLTSMIDQAEDHEDDEEVIKDVEQDTAMTEATQPGADAESNKYDAYKRAPEHANADGSCLWETLPFLAHFHPSVSLSAEHLIDHKPLPGKPDLTIHTMIHFLDRFVYKNAKLSATNMRGSSIMQPMANDDTRSVLIGSASGARKLPINSEEFRSKKQDDVAADDVFFHKYFNNLGKSATKKTKKVRHEDEESVVSDDEDEVWKAMMNNAPDLDGLGDDDAEISDESAFEDEMQDDDEDSVDGDLETNGLDINGDDEEDSVDIEAGIFDDSEDDADVGDAKVLEAETESEFEGLDSDTDQKKGPSKKTREQREKREKKKKMKALPTFASAADYAKLLDNDEDEDLG